MDNKGQSYETIMENSTGYNNPNNIKYIADLMGLGQENYSNMVGLRERFPQNEYATELRQTQASKWAFRSVAEGIEHFKAGRHSEAFQCLNKALTVDPRNVEGLVARGALYANSGNFKKAIDDFETALKLNQTHANARKYMAETLVALGRSYEDEKKFEDAQKAYEQCLSIAPYHEEARNSIEFIKTKVMNTSGQAATLNPIETFKTFAESDNATSDTKKEKKKRKKERKSRSKKRQRWSSSSSSSSSGSSSSSSSESSSSSSSGSSRSASRSPNRKRKHKKDHRGSLSPLSKRMAQYNNPPAAATSHDVNPVVPYTASKMDEHEIKVLKFLEQTKDDSDYEGKVRKFLAEAERWKREKEKKHSGSEKTKKKKKKDKKVKEKEKEEKKSRKKKKKEERKKRKNKDKSDRDFDALKTTSLPDLEQLESKLNAYYAKVEKETAVLRRYVDQYNDMPASPLSNAEKLADVTSRDFEFRRERDELPKPYGERERREPMTAQQRKEIQRKPLNDMFEQESQLIHPEMKAPSLDTASLNAKWKLAKQKWQDIPGEKKAPPIDSDDEMEEKLQRAALEKTMSVRKRELAEKRAAAAAVSSMPSPLPPLPKEPPLPKQTPVKYPAPQTPNKYPGYKDSPGNNSQSTPSKFSSSLGGKFQPIGQNNPPEPPSSSRPSSSKSGQTKGLRSDSDSESERRSRQTPRKRDSAPRGPKRSSRGRRSRSRSRSESSSGSSRSRSRSRSYSNRRSGSYERKYSRSPSGTYSRSRSRSRSRSYTRSRSRSRSGDRSGYHRRYRQFRPYNNNRGTYYKPRFQNFNQNHRGGGNFQNRNRFYNNQQQHRFNNRRGGYQNNRGNYQNNRGRMQNNGNRGGRFFRNNQGYRDFRDRRDMRDRRPVSRDRYSDRSYSPDPMRKVDEAKEKINKIIEEENNGQNSHRESGSTVPPPNKRQDGPLSEGEERDDDDYERWDDREQNATETSAKEA